MPVERHRKTFQKRFPGRRLKRCGGAGVLQLNTLVARAHLRRRCCGHQTQEEGETSHKRQPPPATAGNRPDFRWFGFLATTTNKAAIACPAPGKLPAAISTGFARSVVVGFLMDEGVASAMPSRGTPFSRAKSGAGYGSRLGLTCRVNALRTCNKLLTQSCLTGQRMSGLASQPDDCSISLATFRKGENEALCPGR